MPTRSEKRAAGDIPGRHHLHAAPLGTETTISCDLCGGTLVVGERAGARVLRCGRLGCHHREAIPAAADMAAAGATELPGLEEGDAQPAATTGEAAPGAATPASGSGHVARRGAAVSADDDLAARASGLVTAALDPSTSAERPISQTILQRPEAGVASRSVRNGAGAVVSRARQQRIAAGATEVPSRDAVAPILGREDGPPGSTVPDVRLVPIGEIVAHRNARTAFDEEKLAELAESIKLYGVRNPLEVRAAPAGHASGVPWLLVAGERRLRAAKRAGLKLVPVIVRQDIRDDRQHDLLSLIENLQRDDLTGLDAARGYLRLKTEFGMGPTAIADQLGLRRVTVANALRVVEQAPGAVLDLVADPGNRFTMSHAEALLRFAAFPSVCAEIALLAAERGWTAKELERGIPGQWELAQARAIRYLHTAEFDTAVCKACPFDALDTSGSPTCLRPDHFDELQAAAQEQRQRAAEALAQQVRERSAAVRTGQKPAAATVGAEVEPIDESRGLPKLADLGNSVRWLYASGTPASCTDACACRGYALDNLGETVPVCTNPTRLTQLQTTAKAQQTRDHRRGLNALADRVDRRLSELERFDKRVLAVVAQKVQIYLPIEVVRRAAECHLADTFAGYPGLAPDIKTLREVSLDLLERSSALDLLRYIAALVAHEEIRLCSQHGYGVDRCTRANYLLHEPRSTPAPGPISGLPSVQTAPDDAWAAAEALEADDEPALAVAGGEA